MRFLPLCLVVAVAAVSRGAPQTNDLVIYGGTSAGIAAAVQAARMERTVVLIEPTQFLGGLTTGGLGATDIGNKRAIGGIAREFYGRVWQIYNQPQAWRSETRQEYFARRRNPTDPNEQTMWTFEPHVATKIYDDMLREVRDKVTVVKGERLDLKRGVVKQGAGIVRIVMESGREFEGRMFIDATYEGDLMAKAGVSYHIGREGNHVYGETLNGVQAARGISQQFHQFSKNVDPYVIAGDSKSGLLPGIGAAGPGEEFAGDRKVQAYNFRMCTTDVPENRRAWEKPANYDPRWYELLLRNFEAGDHRVPWAPGWMPNRKTDTNNNFAISTDFIGQNWEYPDADYATRAQIRKAHGDWQKGLMWTLANNPRVPEKVRAEFRRLGLAKDEFTDNDNWPRQLYVREARRMTSDYVMTEKNCRRTEVVTDSVGMGAYNMDSHHVQRYVTRDGFVRNEGDVEVGVKPYPISFRSIRPKASQCTNLLAPTCLSASHIAFGSIRMEPVFMVLGQSAATAAVHALEQQVEIQSINPTKLQARLLKDGQVLDFTAPVANVVLIREGKAQAAIVLPDNATELVRLAADDLQSHVKKASGAELPIIKESEAASLPADMTRVLIGESGLTRRLGVSAAGLREEEFRIKAVGRDLVVVARDINHGSLEAQSPAHWWAVCWLLDRHLGVRWLWPGDLGTVVPERKTIVLGEVDVQTRPSLEIRRLRGGDITWKRRHGAVGWRVTYPHWDGGLLRIGGRDAHLVDKFAQTKPGIFAEDVNGKRASLAGHFGKNSLELCISNPDIVGLVVSEWEAGGAPELVNACCADAAIDCTCHECLALDERLSGVKRTKEDFRKRSWTNWPNLSDRYVWFWNQLITRMREKNPKVVLCVSFYSGTAHPPKRQKLVPGILGRLVSPMNAAVWQGWHDAGAERMVFRPNWWRIGASAPYLPLNWVGDYLTAAKGGMIGMDHDALVGFWAVHSPNYYLTARQIFRGDLSPGQILDEYCGAFGPAAPAIRRYLDYWIHHSETVVEKGGEPGWSGARHWQQLPANYPPCVLAPGYRLLAEADALAAGDAPTRRRIEFLRDGLRQLELSIRLIETKGANAEEVRQFARDMTRKHGFWGADAVRLPQHYGVIPRK